MAHEEPIKLNEPFCIMGVNPETKVCSMIALDTPHCRAELVEAGYDLITVTAEEARDFWGKTLSITIKAND